MKRPPSEFLPPYRCGDRVVVLGLAVDGRRQRQPGTISTFQLAARVAGGWLFTSKLDSGLLGVDLTLADLEPEVAS